MIITQKDPASYLPTITVEPVPVGSVGSISEPVAVGDGLFETVSFSSAYFNYTVDAPLEEVTVSSASPAVFSFSGGLATRLTPAVGKLLIEGPNYHISQLLDFRGLLESSYARLSGFTEGTLGALTLNLILDQIETAGSSLFYYDSGSYVTGLQRNPSCWGAAFDFSGVPVTHLFGGFRGGGAMITPRHFICSHHYLPTNRIGTQLRFLLPDGSSAVRTVIGQTTGSDNGKRENDVITVKDLAVLLLDSDVPEGVAIYPLTGDWIIKSEVNSVSGGESLSTHELSCAFLTTDKERRVLFSVHSQVTTGWRFEFPVVPVTIGEGISYTPTTAPLGRISAGNYSEHSDRFPSFGKGDSGSPVFVPLPGNGLALYATMTTISFGTYISASQANAMILEVDARAGVSTGYTVTVTPNPLL